MDSDNPVVRLCVSGMQAEAAGDLAQAASCFQQAWEACQDDYDACIAAHYMARHQEDPQDVLYWNQLALERAEAAGSDRVRDFYPSLYLNLGYSYELLGEWESSIRYYTQAGELAGSLPDDRYANTVRDGAARGLQRAGELLTSPENPGDSSD